MKRCELRTKKGVVWKKFSIRQKSTPWCGPTAPGARSRSRSIAGSKSPDRDYDLHEALLRHKNEIDEVLAIDPRSLKTEGEISAYVQKATAILHTYAAKPSGKPVR